MALAKKTLPLRGVIILFRAPAYSEGHFNNQQKEESHEKVSGVVPNGYGGNAKDDGEYEYGGKKEEYGGVGGVDEEEHDQLCRLWRACWKDKAGRGERCN